jgi:phosphatidylglycerophosphatase A
VSAPSAARRFLSTGCGVGWLPVAPGTWASAATVLLFALLFGVRGAWGPLLALPASGADLSPDVAGTGPASAVPSPADAWRVIGILLAALALLFAAGVWLGNRAPADFGASDPGAFVLDEVVGQGLALLPLLPGAMSPWGALASFALFRVFDIRKPPPCARLEKLHGGLGIMADDVMAGLYAAAVVALLPA